MYGLMETSLYSINILCWCYSWYIRIWMGFWSLWQIYQFHCFQLYCSGFWNCHTICIFIRVISYCSICDGIIIYDLFLVTFHVKWVLGTYLVFHTYLLTEKPFFNNDKIKIILLFVNCLRNITNIHYSWLTSSPLLMYISLAIYK